MTTSDVETRVTHSPLRDAREWRGITLVAAARQSGLPVGHAEALEEGTIEAFSSAREMIGAAVVYGASLGIGRDEAVALLDRTISRRQPELPPMPEVPVQGGLPEFSAAVRAREVASPVPTTPPAARDLASEAFDNMPARGAVAAAIAAGNAGIDAGTVEDGDTGEIPVVQPEGVRAAMADPVWRAAYEQSSSELETWAAAREGGPVQGSVRLHGWVEKLAGAERADKVVAVQARAADWTRRTAAEMREWLRRSEHATLIVAVAVGIVLIALLVAIASVFDGGSSSKPQPISATTTTTTTTAAATPATTPAKTTAKPTAILPPAKVHLQVLNTGSKKGYAAQMAATLKGLGYPIDAVGNSHTGYATSTILCPKSMSREAQRLSRQTKITTMDTLPDGGGRAACLVVLN